jgi:DNA mismatch endonuclease (patch repair protein)
MADVWSKSKRSEVMSLIRGSGNVSTELKLVGIFRNFGVKGWRRKIQLIGKPDFVFAKDKLAIFVDGCFWHGCPSCYRPPKSNQEFWNEKVKKNRMRDRHVTDELLRRGWRVLRLWEHQLIKPEQVVDEVMRLRAVKKARERSR